MIFDVGISHVTMVFCSNLYSVCPYSQVVVGALDLTAVQQHIDRFESEHLLLDRPAACVWF